MGLAIVLAAAASFCTATSSVCQRLGARGQSAAGMSAGISLFLLSAAPSGGRLHAPATLWWLAGLIVGCCVLFAVALAARWPPRAPSRRRIRDDIFSR
jgi:hypothetical protein